MSASQLDNTFEPSQKEQERKLEIIEASNCAIYLLCIVCVRVDFFFWVDIVKVIN